MRSNFLEDPEQLYKQTVPSHLEHLSIAMSSDFFRSNIPIRESKLLVDAWNLRSLEAWLRA